MSLEYTLRFDGACWPNPGGRASYGYTIVHDGKQIAEGHGIAGNGKGMSNNFAEFFALYKGLERFMSFKAKPYGVNLNILGDSAIVIKMMSKKAPKGRKDKLYYPAFIMALIKLQETKKYCNVFLQWIPRAQNQDADDLSKIDQIEECPYEGNKLEKKLKFGNNSLDKRLRDVIDLDIT